MESEAMRGPGSIPTWGKILSWDFFQVVKPLMPILVLLPILSICEKSECFTHKWTVQRRLQENNRNITTHSRF